MTRVAVCLSLLAVAVFAQEPKRPEPPRFDINAMIDRTVKSSVELYKLDDAQTDLLRELLQDRFKAGMSRMEAIGKVFQDARARREAGEEIDREAIFEKARPLIEEARKFREQTRQLVRDEILDERQKKIFDEHRTKGSDPLTGQSQDGPFGGGGRRGFNGRGFQERGWEFWLERAGTAAKMNPDQMRQASELLELAKQAAANYRKDREADFQRIAADLAKARDDKNVDPERVKAIERAGEELGKPVEDIGNRWKSDVLRLLDEKQRKAVEEADRSRRPPEGKAESKKD